MNRQLKVLKFDVTTHFAFGRNWAEYARHINETTIEFATAELRRLAGPIEGLSFLDIGCGSGLHSLAALRLGAIRVLAVDFDPVSVETANRVIGGHWRQGNFECRRGNVFVDLNPGAGQFDVVYSWGVLHHTGAMWDAIERAAAMVAPGGRLVLAIYRKTPLCGFWRAEKNLYRRLPRVLQAPLDLAYVLACTSGYLLSGRNPVREIRAYRSRRGMSWWHDIRDWMGGFPYESAHRVELEAFLARLGFRLTRAFKDRPARWVVRLGLLGSGCAEYVFERM
jgi:2-polyprenyl-6-hydroxyphenyl methylase/3-demethylubiquinone-9 3-methyltransferase